ncbi:MAG: alpha/beta fold hydrolase [Candidatus Melainabacteria bacterium]|nr:alpha/beta fold hydrolase [Candidatus Melainabacteria bacterium]
MSSSLLLVGCQSGGPTPPEGEHAATEEEEEATSEEEAAEAASAHTTLAPAEKPLPSELIQMNSADGFKVVGRLYDPWQVTHPPAPPPATDEAAAEEEEALPLPPKKKPRPPEPYPLVVLLHGLDGRQADWGFFVKRLVWQGYAVLTLDLRGHGESVGYTGPQKQRSWRTLTETEWRQMPNDLGRVLRYLKKSSESDYPQIDAEHVAVLGASIGANTAVVAGSNYPDTIQALALLSPGINLKGIETPVPLVAYPNAVMLMASEEDPVSFSATQKLYQMVVGAKAIRLYRGVGTGVEMLFNHPPIQDELIRWLHQTLPPTSLPPGMPALPVPKPPTPAKAAGTPAAEPATAADAAEKSSSAAKAEPESGVKPQLQPQAAQPQPQSPPKAQSAPAATKPSANAAASTPSSPVKPVAPKPTPKQPVAKPVPKPAAATKPTPKASAASAPAKPPQPKLSVPKPTPAPKPALPNVTTLPKPSPSATTSPPQSQSSSPSSQSPTTEASRH